MIECYRVLDVLSQPVLGPVDLLTADGHLLVLKDNPELVVLHLVSHTGKVGDGTEALLLVLEVQVHVVLQVLQLGGIVRVLRDGEDVGKEDVVLLIDPAVVRGKRLVPDIRLRHLMLEVALVTCWQGIVKRNLETKNQKLPKSVFLMC